MAEGGLGLRLAAEEEGAAATLQSIEEGQAQVGMEARLVQGFRVGFEAVVVQLGPARAAQGILSLRLATAG